LDTLFEGKKGDVGAEATYDSPPLISGDIIPILISSVLEIGQPEEELIACP
jgi:hypothetical protein